MIEKSVAIVSKVLLHFRRLFCRNMALPQGRVKASRVHERLTSPVFFLASARMCSYLLSQARIVGIGR
jgi:hypothetical protein